MRRAIFSEHIVCCENPRIQDTAANPIIAGRCGGNKIIMIVKRTTLSGVKGFIVFIFSYSVPFVVECRDIAIAPMYRVRQWVLTSCNTSVRELNVCGAK